MKSVHLAFAAALALSPGLVHAQDTAAPQSTPAPQANSSTSAAPAGTSDIATPSPDTTPVPQGTPQATQGTLAVTGHPGQVPLVVLNGRSYVEVEDLARITQGSLSFNTSQTTLTLAPAAPAAAPAALAAADTKPKEGFSKEFIQSAIEEMGVIREWRATIMNAVSGNYPISQAWVLSQHRLADKTLSLVSASASTDDDRRALPLVNTEFNNMQTLSDRYLSLRQQASFISPGALDSDTLDQQILACSRVLASMAATNKFQTDSTCGGS